MQTSHINLLVFNYMIKTRIKKNKLLSEKLCN